MFESALLFLIVILCSLLPLFKEKLFFSIQIALSFSGAFLLSVIIFEMLPKAYKSLGSNAGLYVLLGLLLQSFLEFYSKGAEHGHFHFDKKNSFKKNNIWSVYIALCIHAFLEGIPMRGNEHFFMALVLHKIPVSILLVIFLKQIQLSTKRIFLWIIMFAVMTPLGVIGSKVVSLLWKFNAEVSALVSGLLLHIATVILFESKKGNRHDFDRKKLISFLVAATLAYFTTKTHFS